MDGTRQEIDVYGSGRNDADPYITTPRVPRHRERPADNGPHNDISHIFDNLSDSTALANASDIVLIVLAGGDGDGFGFGFHRSREATASSRRVGSGSGVVIVSTVTNQFCPDLH